MACEPPMYTERCDACRRQGWDVRVYRRGHPMFQYCLKCIVGVLVDVRDADFFVVVDQKGDLVTLPDYKWLGVWMAGERLH